MPLPFSRLTFNFVIATIFASSLVPFVRGVPDHIVSAVWTVNPRPPRAGNSSGGGGPENFFGDWTCNACDVNVLASKRKRGDPNCDPNDFECVELEVELPHTSLVFDVMNFGEWSLAVDNFIGCTVTPELD